MPKKNPKGRPKLKLTDKQIAQASKLSGIGCTIEQIAHIFGISESTLERRSREDPKIYDALNKGRSVAKAQVMETAFNMAISGKHPYMTSFWLRVKLGWAEPKGEPLGDDPFNLNYQRPSKENG